MANKTPNKKLRVGILGATGMVGQRFISLLENHPWFEVTVVAASPRSAGKKYIDAVAGRWSINKPSSECGSGCSSELGQWVQRSEMPNFVRNLVVYDVNDVEQIKKQVDFVFSAVDMTKDEIRAIENKYAENDIPVVSNNSAHRWTPDVAMIIPEINPHHAEMIPMQRKNHGWKKGFIVVKPNCSIQSYMPVIAPLMKFNPKRMVITTMQSISGAGKTFETYPDIADNVIPFIGGEEEKSEKEPLKILGSIKNGNFVDFEGMKISAHCNRTPTSDGHMATVSIEFEKKPTREEILKAWKGYKPVPQQLGLPSAPDPVLIYREEENRPQTRLDRDAGKGMAISIGRLRPCNVFDYRFVALSHNTVRGAAGGAILVAELLYKKGYLG
ncbi:MAG: aspartate-semialdehyde dehydrogenase [Nanoarchaeota archaeon]|nr:aspartate-semialdehyde dehydrogenase [Nanoarchaeota archaeon]